LLKTIYAEVTVCDGLTPTITTHDTSKAFRVALIANTSTAIVRLAELKRGDRRLNPKTKWRLVQENFPLGNLLNENTHIFDGCLFKNNMGKRCFLMAALPKAVSETIAEAGIEKWGSAYKIQRLDTIEHLLFRHYAKLANKTKDENGKRIKTPRPQWVIFPQGMGFKILFINEGLPNSVHYISNHTQFREGELGRVLDVAAPESGLLLTCGDDDSLWIDGFLRDKCGFDVDRDVLGCLSRFA